MYYEIERDENGEPIRMWFRNGEYKIAEAELERARLAFVNSLPMPAMREWARARGLIA
jgi:hypothetical protein